MPIYEYKCNSCGCVFEQIILRSETDEIYACPTCGDVDTCRVMSCFSCGPSDSKDDLGGGLSPSCGPSSTGFS